MSDSNYLRTHRFAIGPESKGIIDAQKSYLEKIQERFPQIKGLSWYGSRTKNKERNNSDLDIFIFYDSSEMDSEPRTTREAILKKSGNYLNIMFKHTRQMLSKVLPDKAELDDRFVDISKKATDKDLRAIQVMGYNPPAMLSIVSRFMLGVGEDLYKNRAYILDQLEANPKGEALFKKIMSELQGFERRKEPRISTGGTISSPPDPQYERHPQTIEEARKYFILR